MRTASLALTILVSTIFAAGCGPKPAPRSGNPPLSKPEPTGGGSATDAITQVNDGLEIFGQVCAGCHGSEGEGAKAAPGVIGPNALPLEPPGDFGKKRKVRFRSAKDLFMWTRENMPADQPGNLTDDQYLAVVAFLLKANAIALDRPLTPASSAAVLIHP